MVMRADYKALAEDSQWQQTRVAADINMAGMRGEVYSIALFLRRQAALAAVYVDEAAEPPVLRD